jgi:hypothetical protein
MVTIGNVREVLLAAGYREAPDDDQSDQYAGFALSVSERLAQDRPSAAGVTVTLRHTGPPSARRAVFAGYAAALILGGCLVDYRGRYLYVHAKLSATPLPPATGGHE